MRLLTGPEETELLRLKVEDSNCITAQTIERRDLVQKRSNFACTGAARVCFYDAVPLFGLSYIIARPGDAIVRQRTDFTMEHRR
jgi:hypothetical protein